MNNAKAEFHRVQARKHPAEFRSNSQPPVTARPDDVMRDFFKRGDRGQYEGGAANRALDSIPTWDLPERQQIVRTPQQQARRATLMRVEAFLMAACLVLLVTAARSKLIGGSQQQRAVTVESKRPAVEVQVIREQSAQAKLVAASNAMPPAPPSIVAGTAEPPKMANVSPVNPASTDAPAVSTKAPAAVPASATPTPALAARPRRTVQSQYQPAPVSASPAAGPRRAVAAFPDD